MTRRGLIGAFAFLGMVVLLPAEAQPEKVSRVGILGIGPSPSPVWEPFRQGLRELGYVEGRNVLLEYRSTGGKDDRAAALSAELVQLKVDVIVASSLPVIRATQHATATIPVVMIGSANTTGLSMMATDLIGKRVELLKEAVPKVSRLAVLLGPPAPADPLFLRETEVAAQALRLKVNIRRARDPTELESAFAAMVSVPAPSWCWSTPSSLLSAPGSSSWRSSTGCRQWLEAGRGWKPVG